MSQTYAYTVTPSYHGQFAFIERVTLTDNSHVFSVIVTDGGGDRALGVEIDCYDAEAAKDVLDAICENSGVQAMRDGDVPLVVNGRVIE